MNDTYLSSQLTSVSSNIGYYTTQDGGINIQLKPSDELKPLKFLSL